MANVAYPQIDFFPGPANPSSSRFGFGFGLAANSAMGAAGWQAASTPGHTQPAAFQQLTANINISVPAHRIQKRRHEPEDELESSRHGGRDVTMDRSPTPERPKRAAPKRAKVFPNDIAKDDRPTKENKAPEAENDVDVGLLLASLPPQSLLPLINSLISAQPSLKALILPLIPRPTLDTAIQALEQSARKLRDAYPYSTTPSSFSSATSTTSFGFGSGFGASRSTTASGASGFGRLAQGSHSNQSDGGMRESYILSRLRPHIHEFVSASMSYVPYFSYAIPREGSHSDPSSSSHSAALQMQRKDIPHPTETYSFLAALTTHILSQPPLTQSSLAPLLLPRLAQEWKAWLDKIDEVVNREGGMFGSETVRGWEKGLDEFADAKGPEGWNVMREVRDQWVSKVGWLVGRSVLHPMEEGL
ncbi:hypothetical protein BV22DRAFT_1058846 [Leucogyrophana mollusca]|uniref:Uncharacterized protein n=1 Tax=Leucogyrophana mollusca TaxID=85980 RepID=A0ACB8BRH8_9AGAM|nr:hypothetical protein BV22DRAFT_1058846 [Leucogyrophana mollusca]